MPIKRVSICAAISLFLATFVAPIAAANAQKQVPLSEYGKLPDVEDVAISPSGNRIAMVRTIEGERMLLALENQTKPIRAIKVGDLKIRYIQWVGEDRILLVSSQTEDLPYNFTTDKAEFSVGRIIPLNDGEEGGIVFGNQKKLLDSIRGNYGIRKVGNDYYGYYGAIELAKGRPGGGSRLGYSFVHGRPHLFQFNLRTMKAKKVSSAAPEGFAKDWVIDANGEVAYTLQVNLTSGSWNIRNKEGKTVAQGNQPRASVGLVNLNSDGSKVIFWERGDETTSWYEVGSDGGEPTEFLPDADWERLFFDPKNGHFMGYKIGEDDDEKLVFYDPALEKKANRVRKAFAAFESRITEFTSDLSDVIVKTSGNGDSGSYFAVNLATSKANAIAYERFAIGPEQVGKISTFEYTASDGLEMDGILTLPPGAEPKNLPVVMLPHGGPAGADYPIFDWWAQAFASRGYAVFQPNFRGSTNRSTAFMRAGYGEYGRKMQTDKSDGLKALADAGIVDPNRACIVGASYGGYAALVGVTIQQGIYKCAVAVAPLSDLRDRYQYRYRASGKDRTRKVGLLEQMGDPKLWDDYSPLKQAEKASAPIMLIHGVDDTVVPFSHSSKMADKLKDYGKTYELVTLQGEDHYLSFSETRQQMLSAAVRWVEKHNPPN